MNISKEYYKKLYGRYLNAETSAAEEEELKRFLAVTTDPLFDEAKMVAGLLTASAWTYGYGSLETVQARKPRPRRRLAFAAAVAAMALLVSVPLSRGHNTECSMSINGVTTTGHEVVMDEMNREMTMLLSTDEDNSIESEMSLLTQ